MLFAENISIFSLFSGLCPPTSPAWGANPNFQEPLKIFPNAYASWGLKIIRFIWLNVFNSWEIVFNGDNKKVRVDLSGVQMVIHLSFTSNCFPDLVRSLIWSRSSSLLITYQDIYKCRGGGGDRACVRLSLQHFSAVGFFYFFSKTSY